MMVHDDTDHSPRDCSDRRVASASGVVSRCSKGTELFAVEIKSLGRRQLLSLASDRRPSRLQATASDETLLFATWDESLFMERSQRAYTGERFPDEHFFQETTRLGLRAIKFVALMAGHMANAKCLISRRSSGGIPTMILKSKGPEFF